MASGAAAGVRHDPQTLQVDGTPTLLATAVLAGVHSGQCDLDVTENLVRSGGQCCLDLDVRCGTTILRRVCEVL
ncbi:hypothetical protein [Kribbella sp. VKM Ac-2566]|uniref:hypothetical protein n=1 Tax=Kribbella sp. VKM Ac-2566 TaxID=2512218 RepID=UPI0014170DFE|nr:hypothetical protein [Kribbella sp. VKM Ac-2566]